MVDAKWDGDALLNCGTLPGLQLLGRGKVRDLYEVDANTLLVVSSDRISAFDVIMLNGVPGKGKILNQLTVFWLEHIQSLGLAKHHLITADVSKMPETCRTHAHVLKGRAMLVKRLTMLPVEVIVRGYITGSAWLDYGREGSVCGIPFPPELQRCQKLEKPLYTPSSKADFGVHDENITVEQAAAAIGDKFAQAVADTAVQLYTAVHEYAEPRGVILADTKMEFGVDPKGELTLGDECFTPDCSRYWPKDSYEVGREQDSYDKQYVRNYLLSINFDKKTPIRLPDEVVQQTIDKYTQIFVSLTGKQPEL